MIQTDTDALAKKIWDYHLIHHTLKPADCIFVLCSNDTRVAEYAADLFLKGFAPHLIFSGGFGNFTLGIFDRPEADIFADIAIARGVPKDAIIIENKSKNSGENIVFTKNLLEEKNLHVDTFILVQKPWMERRTYATFKKSWPEKNFIVTSPHILFDEYPNEKITKEDIINIMVGDLQRIKIYPEKGFQIYQEIPEDVWEAYEKLVEAGFTSHLLK